MKRKPRKRIIIKPLYSKCPFCAEKTVPDYKDYEKLKGFLTSRARIYSVTASGVCMKHQKKLSISVKRARFLGLLPYVERV